MKRRTFLSQAAAGGLVAAVVPSLASGSQSKAGAGAGTKLREISTDRAPKPVGPFSQAIKANGFIFEAAESSLDRTVKTTVYLKDMDDFDAMGKVYSRYFPSHPPARATVEVARLHGGRVEIELIAVA